MKIRYAVTVSVLSGMAIGIAGVQALHAQAKLPVYMIALNEVTDPDGYRHEYLPPAQASIKQYGGVYVAAGPGTAIEGELPKGRIVVLRWDSLEAYLSALADRLVTARELLREDGCLVLHVDPKTSDDAGTESVVASCSRVCRRSH